MNSKSNVPIGIYFIIYILSVLSFITLLIIKLTDTFYVTWFWVLATLWMPSCALTLILLIAFVITIVKDKLTTHYIIKDIYNE